MEKELIEVCDAMFVNVACERNDWSDVKCGGPAMLGYEFYVSPDEDKECLEKFLTECIKKYKRPFISISTAIQKNIPISILWTREMMENCIKNNEIY